MELPADFLSLGRGSVIIIKIINFFLKNKIKSNKMSLNFGKNKIFKDEIFVVKKMINVE